MARKTKAELAEIQESIVKLRELLPFGSEVPMMVTHASRSGMQREIKCWVVRDGELVNITWRVAKAVDSRVGKNGGVIMGGCGMDMGFALVNSLSYALHGTESKGEQPKMHCVNWSEATPERFTAGYTLHHTWI